MVLLNDSSGRGKLPPAARHIIFTIAPDGSISQNIDPGISVKDVLMCQHILHELAHEIVQNMVMQQMQQSPLSIIPPIPGLKKDGD